MTPRLVVLFSGHMVDALDRPEPRFPAQQVDVVGERLGLVLEGLETGSEDLGLSGAASGGDILFAETCLRRGMSLELCLPCSEDRFLAESVDPAGAEWRGRYQAVRDSPGVELSILGEDYMADSGASHHVRNNAWMLERALVWGAEKLQLIALWDGLPGDGEGGTADMVESVRQHTDRIHIVPPEGA